MCLCGDSQCPSCGFLQGTLERTKPEYSYRRVHHGAAPLFQVFCTEVSGMDRPICECYTEELANLVCNALDRCIDDEVDE